MKMMAGRGDPQLDVASKKTVKTVSCSHILSYEEEICTESSTT
jgi:hypothetical protein